MADSLLIGATASWPRKFRGMEKITYTGTVVHVIESPQEHKDQPNKVWLYVSLRDYAAKVVEITDVVISLPGEPAADPYRSEPRSSY